MLSLTRIPKAGICLIAAIFAQQSLGSSSASSSGNCAVASSSSSSFQPVSPLTCAVNLTSEWTGGYQVDVKVSNSGAAPTNSWKVVLDIPAGDGLVSAWNATQIAQNQNSYTYANLSWNGVIAPQGAAVFGVSLSAQGATHGMPSCHLEGTGNHAPTANFTAVTKGASVKVESVNAVDADGDKLTYKFDFGDGKSISYPTAWHTYKTPGVYTITQTVSDGKATVVNTHDVTVTVAGTNHAPVGIFSYYSTNLSVGVNGKASADIDGSALTYTWDFGNGPLASTDVISVVQKVPQGGALVTLTVFDGELGDTVQVFASAACGQAFDVAPFVDLATTVNGLTLKADASQSTLADSFRWEFGDGVSATGMFATHAYAAAGTYTVKLTANGGMMGSSKSVTVVIGQVANHPPVADFTAAATGATVNIQSVGVSDADGDALTYQFDFGDGKSIKYPSAWHTYKTPGVYTITQTVSDDKSKTIHTHDVTVTEVSGNHAPVAEFSFYSSNLVIGLDGRASADLENSALTFTWDVGNGPLPGTDVKKLNVTGPEGGTYVTLTVFDGDLGNTVQAQVPAAKGQSWDFLPAIVFSTSVTGSMLNVDASETTGADSFSWDFGDGATGTGMFASHNYATPGTYTVKLRATSAMMSTSKSATVVAAGTLNHPPVACFSVSGEQTASLLASCSSDFETDNLSYAWNFGDGTTGAGVYIAHAYQTPGTYLITLTVGDGITTTSLSKSFTSKPAVKPTRCEYKVTGEWADGYTGTVHVVNQGTAPITSWNVKLTYAGSNRISSFWNAIVSGSNPYNLTNNSWNNVIAPGGFAEVGFVGVKNGGQLETPVLAGTSCQ